MRLRHISIRNFRGIRELDWAIADRGVICLIGRGDSTKSTILAAIRRVFFPQWNLSFDDSDFYNCDSRNHLTIDVVLGDLPTAFLQLSSYGGHLSGWNVETQQLEEDAGDGLEDVIKIRLTVNDDLEPIWRVVKREDNEGTSFKATDRSKVGVNLVDTSSDRDLTWSRGSLLSRLTGGENIPAALAEAGRAAKATLSQRRDDALTKFDEVAQAAETTAKDMGVNVGAAYRAGLDSDGLKVRLGGLALHDGEIPLRQLGLGSKRMITTGLLRNVRQGAHITMLDEVEYGLEPQRIARLLDHVLKDEEGQYFLTTHSPVVLRELAVENLYVVHASDGAIRIVPLNQPSIHESIQGNVRSHAEAFLASRIVVAEGLTEAGFLRGLDHSWRQQGKKSFAYQGLSILDAKGGSRVRGVAKELLQLGYSVAVLADADAPAQFSAEDAAALRVAGADVFTWADDMCLERRVFEDVPWPIALQSVALAAEYLGKEKVLDQVRSKLGHTCASDFATWEDSPRFRTAIGEAAKSCDWFKRMEPGKRWAQVVSQCLGDPELGSKDLVVTLGALRTWIDRA
jgi:hypothetical protein